MNILLTESQLKKITEILVGVDAEKIKNINSYLEDFRDYNKRALIKLDSYSKVPRRFHSTDIFGPIVYNYYTKKGGQFFFISTGMKKYIILLINDKLIGMNSLGENIDVDKLEYVMNLKNWGLTLKELLNNI